MRRFPGYIILTMSILAACAAAAEISMTVECSPPEGWMKDGWGHAVYKFVNEGETPSKITAWNARWEAGGKPVNLGEDEGIADREVVDLPCGEEVTVRKLGKLPPEVVDEAKPENPVWAGTFTIETGSETVEIPWRVEVPEAVLPEKLVTMQGKYTGISLMESRYKTFTAKDRMITWLDQCYEAMYDLTGHKPYNGDMIAIKESPGHPWYAYAGNPIVMDTSYVEDLIEEVNNGIMPFGWIHEMGHDFDDGIGEWYIWNGASSEWQANWKLNYAYETIPDQDFKAKWGKNKDAGYQPVNKEDLVSGPQLMNSFFLFFGDPYLVDLDRTWDTMKSDDLHSFFLRLPRQYGWDVFKKWYRTYLRFEELGLDKPETPEEKINLIAAILSHHTGVDLVPVFQRWRMPVTSEEVELMMKRYPIANESVEKPASEEAAAKLITMKIKRQQPDGWMKKGYGNIEYTFKNNGTLPSKITAWKAQWEIDGEIFTPEDEEESPHDDDVFYIPAGEEILVTKAGWLNPAVAEKAEPNAPVWTGTFTIRTADYEFEIPWRIEVPEAVLKGKLVRIQGKHMAYEVTESSLKKIGDSDRLLRWLDQAYEAMQDLTGYSPYGGEIITIIESPEHPHWAYAGNPIIMNTKYMDNVIKDVKDRAMPFGWIHELAHDFDIAPDVYGYDWYIWSGGACEAQANIKLVYAYEAIPDQDWKTPWPENEHAAYHTPVKDMMLDGKDCMDRRFLFAKDIYLADPTIPWDFGFCQHVFLQRLARVYGWNPVKKWYRTYKVFDEKGLEKPETPEEKVRLMAAILSETVGVDLVPVFQRWRAPVTNEDIEAMKAKYPIEETVRDIVLSSPRSD